MPTDSDKLVRTIAKLTELTQQGKLEWEIQGDEPNASVVGPSYFAGHQDKTLRLRKVEVEYDTGFGHETGYEINLEFVDPEKQSLWTFPETSGLWELYNAVRYGTAGVSDFLDSLLGEG